MMAKNPDDRFQTYEEIVLALRRNEPLTPDPISVLKSTTSISPLPLAPTDSSVDGEISGWKALLKLKSQPPKDENS